MYIVINAVQNIFRNKGRNILVAIIIFAIITTTVVALIINNTASNIIDDYKARFGSEVTIAPDRDKMRRQMQQSTQIGGGQPVRAIFDLSAVSIPPEQYLAFGNSELLKGSRYTAQAGAVSDTLKAVGEDAGNETAGGGTMIVNGREVDGETFQMPTMRVIGNSSLDTTTEFLEGSRAVDEGRIYEKSGECIVSAEFAELNGLNVGDAIEVRTAMGEESVPVTMTVVGVYSDFTDASNGMPVRNAGSNRRNEILTSFETLITEENMDSVSNTGISVTAKFYLKSPSLLDEYREELAAKGLDTDNYIVSTDEAGYNTVVAPVEGLRGVTWAFLIIVLILGAVILILLSAIAIRERKYEIGVLRAMGMKRGKVALGLLTETVIITAVCLIAGLGAGIIASQPASDILLEQQVAAAQNNNSMNGNFGNAASGGGMMFTSRIGGSGESNAQALTAMEVGMTAATAVEIILISLLLAVTASAAGIVNVTRYEPMRILSERS